MRETRAALAAARAEDEAGLGGADGESEEDGDGDGDGDGDDDDDARARQPRGARRRARRRAAARAGPPRPRSEADFDDARLTLEIGQDRVVLDAANVPNDDGWTPLHACCHSHSTVAAGLRLVDEIARAGGSLDLKTARGPGAYNAGWTPLHMAAAYGVGREPLISRRGARRGRS